MCNRVRNQKSLFNPPFACVTQADPSIGPSEYGLVIELYYSNDDNETYLATVYNGTVVVTDSEAPLDAKFLFAGTIILGLAGAGAFYVYGKVNKTGKKSHAPRARKEVCRSEARSALWCIMNLLSPVG